MKLHYRKTVLRVMKGILEEQYKLVEVVLEMDLTLHQEVPRNLHALQLEPVQELGVERAAELLGLQILHLVPSLQC